ncbi:MAG: PIN domain nuclease [Acidimicrobiales bacterium]
MEVGPQAVVDTSALNRLSKPAVEAVVGPLIERGQVATCAIVDLEVLYSTRTGAEWAKVAEELAAMPSVPVTEAVCRRAIAVQGMLWARGKVRSVGLADLLIAAAAEAAEVEVLHYDRDFDLVATVTGQPARWVVEAGSAD